MMTKRFAKTLLLAASAMALCAGSASAAHYDLALTGTVANGSFSNQTIGATHYDQWFLNLDGLDSTNAITVLEGDTITATVTLDQAFTIPASQNLTVVDFFLFGSAFPDVDTGTKDIVNSFFLGGVAGPTGGGSTTTHGQLAAGNVLFPPDNGALTFDAFTSSFTIETLGAPATLDGSGLEYTLFSNAAVPEPATWGLMILGFGGMGAALRGRRRSARPA